MSQFTILHLSDAHIGTPGKERDQQQLFGPLFDDLKTSGRKPDLLVFSGDLAYGSSAQAMPMDQQYQEAEKFVAKLYTELGVSKEIVPFIAPPGNHDVDRMSIDDAYLEYREALNFEKVQKMQAELGRTWVNFLGRQKAWRSFADKTVGKNVTIDSRNMISVKLRAGECNIGVVGFNTSWASQDNSDERNIWIGIEQFQAGYELVKDCDILIAVTHHPLDWLHADERSTMKQKVSRKFTIHLYGHEHDQWFEDISQSHLRAAAGACYCGSESKGNAYSWIVLDTATRAATIALREYADTGAGGWRSLVIPGLTDGNGQAELTFLRSSTAEPSPAGTIAGAEGAISPIANPLPASVSELCGTLEDDFYVRKECAHSKCTGDHPLVYWPVKLREPAPIHAAQAFVAAGLSQLGCNVSLWIDDLGNTKYSRSSLEGKIKQWFERAKGKTSMLASRSFSEIRNGGSHTQAAWEILQNWLGNNAFYTDDALRISKILPSRDRSEPEPPEHVLQLLARRRPRRLMNPSMVWTCLRILHQENPDLPITTLGGHDEKDLWKAWRTCCDFEGMQVCHLYVSKLSDGEVPVHLKETPLAWKSKEDIEAEFRRAIGKDASPQLWDKNQSMIPWVINNCVLMPNFIANGRMPLRIAGKVIANLSDLEGLSPSNVMDDLVRAVNQWLL